MPGLPGVEARAAREQLPRSLLGNSQAVVLDLDVDHAFSVGIDGDEHAAAAIFRGILDQVAEHFVEVLALDPRPARVIAGDVDR